MITAEEILKFIENDRISPLKVQAQTGMRYFEGEHDIKQHRIFYYDSDEHLVEDKYRTNVRISHPFFPELVLQATNYLVPGKEQFVKADDPVLQCELDEYFDNGFRYEVKELLNNVQIGGYSYVYRYADGEGNSRFEHADGQGVIEVPGKFTSDGLDYVIYYYTDQMLDKDGKKTDVEKVQVWDSQQTHFFIIVDSKIEKDTKQEINPRPHVIYREGGELYCEAFDEIPFYRMDNNQKRTSELKLIKDLIDDYDIHACSLTNDIQDFAQAIYVVKNFAGDDLDKLQKTIKAKKIVGVDEQGGVDIKTVDIPYEARQVKLKYNRENIHRFGMGFDSTQLGDGHITNVVIKSRYTLLDLKCNRLESRLRSLMEKLIEIALDEVNGRLETAYTLKDVYMEFDRTMITNELDNANTRLVEANEKQALIDAALTSSEYLKDEQIMEFIGNALDIDVSENDLETLRATKTDLLVQARLLGGMTND